METKILKTDDESIAEAGRIAAQGGLVAFPTETVYGLGASAYDETSVARIYAAKGRPSDNPLIVHIADISDIDRLAESVSAEARRLIEAFMPGPFTIILKKSAIVPDAVTAGMDTVGIRFPENDTAQRFIRAAGVPIACLLYTSIGDVRERTLGERVNSYEVTALAEHVLKGDAASLYKLSLIHISMDRRACF